MKLMGIGSVITYKGSQHTVTALENAGSGIVFVVLLSDKNKKVRIVTTEFEELLSKGTICLNSASESPTDSVSNASSSNKKKKRSKSAAS
tara:strand:+ start:973 stop:1242 length:270 start_codon:yes stop_codon:yes gene_type:complete